MPSPSEHPNTPPEKPLYSEEEKRYICDAIRRGKDTGR